MTLAALFCWAAFSSAIRAAEVLPLLLYSGLVMIVLMPLPLLHRASRQFFATTCQRVLLPAQVRAVASLQPTAASNCRRLPAPALCSHTCTSVMTIPVWHNVSRDSILHAGLRAHPPARRR
jgi:hypothetical protein